MLSRAEIEGYLEEQDETAIAGLLRSADRVRREQMGDAVHLRGLIEFSNICRRNCAYCGLRRDNARLVRYRMTAAEIAETAREARNLSLKTVVLQSGEDTGFAIGEMCRIVNAIKTLGLAVTLSLGELSRDDYRRLKDAGADRYLLRFETSDAALFARLRPGTDLGRRLCCLDWLKEAGYQVGSGIMVGLPGQSTASLAEDILTLQALDLDMIGLGPFIANPDTPLAGEPNGTIERVLRVTALVRLTAGAVHIPATTATATIDPAGWRKALCAGANVIMPNLTPRLFRRHYALYPGKAGLDDDPRRWHCGIESLIQDLDRTLARDAGHSLKRRGIDIDDGKSFKSAS